MTLPVSVILTTYNRAELLPAVLAGFERQSADPSHYELVVVDDGSSDATQRVLEDWSTRLPLRTFTQDNAGLAAAKNLGVFAARGQIVIFADDDDVPGQHLVAAHLACHLAEPDRAVAVLGRTELDPAIAGSPLMRHVTEIGCQLFSYGRMEPGQELGFSEFWGGRSSCKRAFLLEQGVFNPVFTFGCEDIELAWRLRTAGLRVLYEPRAMSTMIRSLTFDQFCNRSYRQGRSQALFASLHQDPEVRAICEIDDAQRLWTEAGTNQDRLSIWTRRLEDIVVAASEDGSNLDPAVRRKLDVCYRLAFRLARARGIVEAPSFRAGPAHAEACTEPDPVDVPDVEGTGAAPGPRRPPPPAAPLPPPSAPIVGTGSSDMIHSFWYGERLSAFEVCCIQSFIAQGHPFALYSYSSDLNVPAGVDLRDAGDLFPEEQYFVYQSGPGMGSHALFSNLMRYMILLENGGWWVDTDVVCLTPRMPDTEEYFAFQEVGSINGAVLRLPRGHSIARQGLEQALRIRDRAEWGDIGPNLVTRLVTENGLLASTQPMSRCYPVHYSEAMDLLRPSRAKVLTERIRGADFLHLWNEMFRRESVDKNVRPPAGSTLRSLFDGLGPADWQDEYPADRFEDDPEQPGRGLAG